MATNSLKPPIGTISVTERMDLIGRLWDSLIDDHADLTPEWHRDIVQQRVIRADANPERAITLDELQTRIANRQR